MNILLIEDERAVAQGIIRLLSEGGYHVDWVRTGKEGLDAAESKTYDLVMLEVLLRGMSGWEVCRQLREHQINTQLMILSSLNEPDEVARGLDLGADDYVCKPYDPKELLARVRARVRTGAKNLGRQIQVGDLQLDRVAHTVIRSGKRIPLTRSEYSVLERLAADAGKAVPVQVLAREAGYAPDPLDDPLEYCLASLSRKIDEPVSKPLIQRGADGYMLTAQLVA